MHVPERGLMCTRVCSLPLRDAMGQDTPACAAPRCWDEGTPQAGLLPQIYGDLAPQAGRGLPASQPDSPDTADIQKARTARQKRQTE